MNGIYDDFANRNTECGMPIEFQFPFISKVSFYRLPGLRFICYVLLTDVWNGTISTETETPQIYEMEKPHIILLLYSEHRICVEM
jgi:hypothetical protein